MYLCASVNTLRHMLIGTNISPSLFLHGSETKVGVVGLGTRLRYMHIANYSNSMYTVQASLIHEPLVWSQQGGTHNNDIHEKQLPSVMILI